jgi:hypothetical protein
MLQAAQMQQRAAKQIVLDLDLGGINHPANCYH